MNSNIALVADEDDKVISSFQDDVLRCFLHREHTLPARWLYDHRGSELFEEITGLPEYYPTRTELALLRGHANDIADAVGKGRMLVEFGAGSSTKTPALIEAIAPARYVPIDVSGDFLRESSAVIADRFPAMEVAPIEADFNYPVALPHCARRLPIIGFFPGSTIGNLNPPEATDLLRRMAQTLGPDAMLLIGIDRIKPLDILLPAYDDAAGVTAQFNLNLLHRINRELGAQIPIEKFKHDAIWNEDRSRIEMHLRARERLSFTMFGATIELAEGETIHTENSHKLSEASAQMMLRCGGWRPLEHWTDEKSYFSLFLARVDEEFSQSTKMENQP